MVMRHAVEPLMEGFSNLPAAAVPALCAACEYFRDVYDHLQRLNQTADSFATRWPPPSP